MALAELEAARSALTRAAWAEARSLGEHDPAAAVALAREAGAASREIGSTDYELVTLALEGLARRGRHAPGTRPSRRLRRPGASSRV